MSQLMVQMNLTPIFLDQRGRWRAFAGKGCGHGIDQMIVIADASKRVETLGKFPLPIEVLQFGADATQKLIANLLVRKDIKELKSHAEWRAMPHS